MSGRFVGASLVVAETNLELCERNGGRHQHEPDADADRQDLRNCECVQKRVDQGLNNLWAARREHDHHFLKRAGETYHEGAVQRNKDVESSPRETPEERSEEIRRDHGSGK